MIEVKSEERKSGKVAAETARSDAERRVPCGALRFLVSGVCNCLAAVAWFSMLRRRWSLEDFGVIQEVRGCLGVPAPNNLEQGSVGTKF